MRELERLKELDALAEEAAMKAGEVYRCPHHDEIILRRADTDAERRAYAIGTNMIKAGKVLGTREEFMDAIKEAITLAELECPACDHVLSRD